jgi:hypothetical protein
MTRSFDTIPEETERTAEVSKPSAAVMSVCPFCGAIAEKNDAACPRCKMENTALTRQATRARIGPWYVMQSRNPSAPGMKCNTLLALIRKGQVTPRSVIRGPTTFQLWRFAARVKGISREFGLCYSCGAELQRTSTFCPRCSRSQELPPNPDVLLETEPQASKPVYREVVQRPAEPRDLRGDTRPPETDSSSRSQKPAEPEIDRPIDRQGRPPSQIPSAAETMAELAQIPSPHDAPTELRSRPRQRPQEGVLTPRELAAAFSLQYDPTMDSGVGGSRRRGGHGILTAAILLLVAGGAASTFYFVPSLRERFVAWVQDTQPPAPADNTSTADSPLPKPLPDHTAPWNVNLPDDVPPITTPQKPAANDSAVASATPVGSSAQVPTPVQSQSPAPAPVSDKPVAPAPAPAPVITAPAPQPAPEPAPQPAVAVAPPAVATPPANSSTAAAEQTVQQLRQSTGGDLDELAMQLRSNGLDAEGRQDFSAAEYYFQQVENLPRDHWPSDIDQLLKEVQQRLADANH